jgi:hypothetical protein
MNTSSEPRTSIDGRGALVACEGRDDEEFLLRMLQFLRVANVAVRRYDGTPRLPAFLLGLRDSTEFETIRAVGIVRDADERADSAFQSVADRLDRLGLPRPRRVGDISVGRCELDGLARAFGVFILPDGQASGALEELCLRAIEGDSALACAEEFLGCVQTRARVACTAKDQSKARLNAWLASRRNPSLRIGTAIAAHQIPPDSPAFGAIRDFLTRLAAAASDPGAPAP